MLKTVVLLNIFVETEIFFSGFFDELKVFTGTFDQLNASLLGEKQLIIANCITDDHAYLLLQYINECY